MTLGRSQVVRSGKMVEKRPSVRDGEFLAPGKKEKLHGRSKKTTVHCIEQAC